MSERKLTEEARQIAKEIHTQKGPNRVMEVQRARMWDREPGQWTRYERRLADALEAALAREQAFKELAHYFFDELVDRWHHSDEDPASLASWLGLTDEQYAAFVEGRYIDAAQALAAVPVETQEAVTVHTRAGDDVRVTATDEGAPDDYTRPGWRMFPVL